MSEDEKFAPGSFEHKNNIRVGAVGRILWAGSTTCSSGIIHPAGWVLPGGERTSNEARARFAALLIDQLSVEQPA